MPNGPAKDAAKQRFHLRIAALYASQEGTMETLSILSGVKYPTLKSQALPLCRTSKATKEGIRRILGDTFVPPEVPALRSRQKSNGHDL
jgi:hypothetical protein